MSRARYVLEFSKQGYVRYVSHLDLMRIFKRAFRRSGIPVSYSNGFNPHPKMSISLPLTLGNTSASEYLEFYTDGDDGRDEWIGRLSRTLPKGVEPLRIGVIGEDMKRSVAASVVSCGYRIGYPPSEEDRIGGIVTEINRRDTLPVEKKSKKGPVTVDIRPKIRSLALDPKNACVRAELDAGPASDLSVELLIKAAAALADGGIARETLDVERTHITLDIDYHIDWL